MKRAHPIPARTAAALAAAWLAGCSITGPQVALPPSALPPQFDAATAPEPAPAIPGDWWKLYGDDTLTALVDASLTQNLDLKLALLRVEQATSVLAETRTALQPTVDGTGSVSRSRSSTVNGQPVSQPVGNSFRLGLSTAFELDLWGRLRHLSDAAQAQLLSTQLARDTVRLSLAGTTTQAYFTLRSLDAQIAVSLQEQRLRAESLRLVERRLQAGTASGLEAAQARSALAAIDSQLPELRRQRAAVAHQLGALTARPGLLIAPGDLRALPMPATPPAGLPSQLLERRPDLRRAEQDLAAANAQVSAARAAMYPTLSLTGSLGLQSRDLDDLFSSGARVWSFGPSLLVPLFDGNRRQLRTEQARLQAEQAAVGYQQAVQAAFRETADALTAVEEGARQEAAVGQQAAAAAEALRIATRRHEAGYASFLEVLDAQRTRNDAELALVRVRQARLAASVDLMKALGGGWVPEAPTAAR